MGGRGGGGGWGGVIPWHDGSWPVTLVGYVGDCSSRLNVVGPWVPQVLTNMSLEHTTVFYHQLPGEGDTQEKKRRFIHILLAFLGERALVFCNVGDPLSLTFAAQQREYCFLAWRVVGCMGIPCLLLP